MPVVKSPYEEKLYSGIFRLQAKVLGLVLGFLFAIAIFVATNWLVVQDGRANVESHLRLLSQLFIGYRVSFWGSIVGAAYGFAIGTLCGALVGWIYNKFVDFRN